MGNMMPGLMNHDAHTWVVQDGPDNHSDNQPNNDGPGVTSQKSRSDIWKCSERTDSREAPGQLDIYKPRVGSRDDTTITFSYDSRGTKTGVGHSAATKRSF